MVKINFIGQLFGASGYVAHTKGLVNALYKQNKEIHLDVNHPAGWEVLVNDAELEMINNPWYKDGVTVMIALPHQWDLTLVEPQKQFWGFVVWEGETVPKFWEEHLNDPRVTGILVPSQHVKDAINNTFTLNKPVHIISHGVSSEFHGHTKPAISPDAPFTFVGAGGWARGIHDRKGIQWLIKAFSEEFSRSEPVRLQLNINPVYNNPGWDLTQEIQKLELPEDRPDVSINCQLVDRKDLPKFYVGDCFVYPTMGEAFGLTCAEAMACGLPVITTRFGGQCDYMSEQFGWFTGYGLVENVDDYMYEGIKWALPDLMQLRSQLRYAYENRDECRVKGADAAEWVKTNLLWDKSAEVLLKLFI